MHTPVFMPKHPVHLSDDCSLVVSCGRSIIEVGEVENILMATLGSAFWFFVVVV